MDLTEHKGYVYVLHFNEKLSHAQHYIGWSKLHPERKGGRIEKHRKGTSGVSIMRAIKERGIGFEVSHIFENVDGHFERSLKNKKCTPRHCPICKAKKGT